MEKPDSKLGERYLSIPPEDVVLSCRCCHWPGTKMDAMGDETVSTFDKLRAQIRRRHVNETALIEGPLGMRVHLPAGLHVPRRQHSSP